MSKTYTQNEVKDLIADAVQEAVLIANAGTIDPGIRERLASLMSGGYDFADTLHNVYLDFGYPAQLTFFNYWNMYRRFGVARNVIEIYPEMGWMEDPEIEASSGLLSDIEALNRKLGLWTRLKGLDTRQRVGRYAGLFMRVRDGKQPHEPIEGKLSGVDSLVDMIPLYESQLEVIDTQDDVMADDYGQPTMYQFKGTSPGARNPDTQTSFNIHPSRVIIASEDSDNGSIYGVSCLEAIYNSLLDLRKIIGAGGEGFYKNAAQSIVFDLKDGASATKNEKLLNKFNDQYDDFARNRARRAIWTPGMESKTLESSLANPKEFFMNALNDVAAGSKYPATIIIGQQTGRLASDQDSRWLLGNVQSRRKNFQTDVVSDVLDWMIKYGIVQNSEFDITWPDALALSDTEKLENADKMVDINKKSFESGQPAVFLSAEIREAAGHEEIDEDDLPEPDESLDDDEEIEDDDEDQV